MTSLEFQFWLVCRNALLQRERVVIIQHNELFELETGAGRIGDSELLQKVELCEDRIVVLIVIIGQNLFGIVRFDHFFIRIQQIIFVFRDLVYLI